MFRLHCSLMVAALATFFLVFSGCSNSGTTIVTGEAPSPHEAISNAEDHSLWGLWQFTADPAKGTLEMVEMREAQLHLNALKYLEPPPNLYLTLESPPQFNGGNVTVDIGLRHPFLGLQRYTGFDVCGVLIGDASYSPGSSGLNIGGVGDTRLLNADGYTRWWNPNEFPYDGSMFGYIDGALGVPDSTANFNANLNGYKYFADDLPNANDPISMVDPEGRGVFTAGAKNVRRYVINLDSGLIFNYAIDACWTQPIDNGPPVEVPGDFPQTANRPEPWNISVEVVDNTIFYDSDTGSGGGSATLSIDVYDWFNVEQDIVNIYSFGGEFPDASGTPSGGGTGFSTYTIEIFANPISTNDLPVLIEADCEVSGYGGKLPGEALAAYQVTNLTVQSGSITDELPDICNNWTDETGPYHHWNNGQEIHDIYTQFNLESDNQGNVWMWSQRTSNALSRCKTPYNGNWNNMWEMDLMPGGSNYWIFGGSTVDVSLTRCFDGTLLAGCSPQSSESYDNWLSLAWWDGSQWWDKENQWIIYGVTAPDMVANRINGYKDSTGEFHAFMQINSELVDYYGSTWMGDWQTVSIGQAPVGQADYACQTRTDFVGETSDGWIYLVYLNDGIRVTRSQAGSHQWDEVFHYAGADYDSPTICINHDDEIFIAARQVVDETEDHIVLFKGTTGTDFLGPTTIFSEAGSIVDPCYLTLKDDILGHLFLVFPYRPGEEGAYTAIMASNKAATEWTAYCVLSNPVMKHPGLAVRPDGSIEVTFGYNSFGDLDAGSTDDPFSERQFLYGRSHQGFIN